MKYLKYLVVLLVTVISLNVEAFSTTLSGTSKITSGGEVKITVGVSGASNLWGFKAPISYDSSKLTLTNYSGLNGFGIAVGTNLVADASSGKNGAVNVATLTFKATGNFAVGEKTTISLGTAEGSDGENLINGNGSSHTVTMSAPASTNNNLASLSVSPSDINFNKNTKEYNITVEHDVTSININATAEDNKAKVTGVGNKELNLYTNTFSIVVTAENGSKKTYTINVIRKDAEGNIKELSTNNRLSVLSINNYQISFNPDILEYTILMKDVIKDTDITATAEDQFATVTLNMPDELKNGNNVITISVIAENGEEKQYKINAVSLKDIKVSDEVEESSINSWKIVSVIESILIISIFVLSIVFIKTKKINLNFKKN